MTKQAKQLIILVLALGACIGAYFGLRAWNQSKEDQEAAASQAAVIRLAELTDITSISFENSGTVLSFEKQDDKWVYADNTDFPLDVTYIETIATLLADLQAVSSYEDADTLAAYGLDSPSYQLTAETKGGDSFQIYIGDLTGSYYYARVEGSDAVYTIAEDLVTGISYQLLDLVELETFPTLSQENLEAVTFSIGNLTLTKNATATDIEVEQDTGEVDENGDAIYETVTQTNYTYTWYIGDIETGQEISSGNTILTGLLDALPLLSFSSCYNYAPDDAAFAACGLDGNATKITIEYAEVTVVLLIGNAADEAGSYYATLEGSDMIYIMSSTYTSVLLNVDETGLTAESEA